MRRAHYIRFLFASHVQAVFAATDRRSVSSGP